MRWRGKKRKTVSSLINQSWASCSITRKILFKIESQSKKKLLRRSLRSSNTKTYWRRRANKRKEEKNSNKPLPLPKKYIFLKPHRRRSVVASLVHHTTYSTKPLNVFFTKPMKKKKEHTPTHTHTYANSGRKPVKLRRKKVNEIYANSHIALSLLLGSSIPVSQEKKFSQAFRSFELKSLFKVFQLRKNSKRQKTRILTVLNGKKSQK